MDIINKTDCEMIFKLANEWNESHRAVANLILPRWAKDAASLGLEKAFYRTLLDNISIETFHSFLGDEEIESLNEDRYLTAGKEIFRGYMRGLSPVLTTQQ